MAQDRDAQWRKAQAAREAFDQVQRAETEERDMAWLKPEPQAEVMPDENVLCGLREVQRTIVKRMRKDMVSLVWLWRRRGTPGERRCARELARALMRYPVARRDEE